MKFKRPTEEAYEELQAAYDYYNDHLFEALLPPCLITFQREKRSMGYFSKSRFIRRDGVQTDEIAMNPDFLRSFRWSRYCRPWCMRWPTSGRPTSAPQVEPATTIASGL